MFIKISNLHDTTLVDRRQALTYSSGMDAVDTFDRLVTELSIGERRELLSRLDTQAAVSTAPLFRADEVPERVQIERRFQAESLILKVYLGVLSFFKGKPPTKLYEERLLNRIGAAIENRFPAQFDYRRGVLGNGFFRELISLKESSRFFYNTLDESVVRDKVAFFAFLASMEINSVHTRLLTETDPYQYASTNSQATESDIRIALNHSLEEILQDIDEDQRRIMYRNVRSLLCLKELASYLFDRTLSSFSGSEDGKGCPAYLVQDQLKVLNDILFSLDFPPSMPLLESIFVFSFQDRLGEPDFDLIAATKEQLAGAEVALARIRQFNQKVPLTALIRYSSRDLSYVPSAITGGEDWFATYRDFWRKRLEERFDEFIKNRRREQLGEALSGFFNRKTGQLLVHARSAANPNGIPLKGAFTLMFLSGFYQHVFADEINRALKLLLLEGEFYKKDNRVEFTDAYNELLKLGDALRALDFRISEVGDLGKRYDFARKEMTSLAVRRKKMMTIVQDADTESAGIIDRTSRAIHSLALLLGGILHGEAGGKYDSLSNMGIMANKANGSFMVSLRNALQKIDKAIQLLGEIEGVESVR